jgi:hypothetical protein
MTFECFWKMIDDARQASGKLVEMPARLVDALALMAEHEIVDFDSHLTDALFRSYDANLWLGAVVILNGCGDDTFTDFRYWLIAQGRETFESALADPDSLAGLERFDGDHGLPLLFYMIGVAKEAFCRRVAGRERDSEAEARFEALCPVKKHPSLRNQKLINKSDEEAMAMFPRLAARFPKKKHTSCFDEYAV